MEQIKIAEEIAKQTKYEDLACEILKDIEFKDEKAIAQAILQLSNFLQGRELAEQNCLQDKFNEGYTLRMDEEKKNFISDEEIEKGAIIHYNNSSFHSKLFIRGAEWMRDKIFKTEK